MLLNKERIIKIFSLIFQIQKVKEINIYYIKIKEVELN